MTHSDLARQPSSHVKAEPVFQSLSPSDMEDLCDACDLAVKDGGGFGWVKLPSREAMERYFEGLITVPNRILFVGRLDDTIAGAAVLNCPPSQNEAQAHAVILSTNFVAPWAREHGLSSLMLERIEAFAIAEGFKVIQLDVDETQEAAIRLYENAGYERFGANPYGTYKDGAYITAFHYAKKIELETV